MVHSLEHVVPDFGPVIERSHLLRMVGVARPELTVICAPPGFGKSVFAAQLARESSATSIRWATMHDCDARGDEWVSRIVALVGPEDAAEERGPGAILSASAGGTRADAMLRIMEGLRSFGGEPLTVVLDGIGRVEDLEMLEDIASLLRRSTSVQSMLIVTCRSIGGNGRAPDPEGLWFVSGDDLRFDEREINALMECSRFPASRPGEARRLLDRFCGHPALTALMLRHARIDDNAAAPQDLIWYMRRLVSQLPSHVHPALYAAALLGEGHVAEIGECVQSVDAAPFDVTGLCMASPLVTVNRRESGPPSFRMHAILRDVLLNQPEEWVSRDIANVICGRALTLLAHAHDWVRTHAILLAACDGAEIASWCERSGSQMLCALGPAAVERCLDKVPAAVTASSARVLLLRATVLREREHLAEALSCGLLARRMAEVDGDIATESAAALLEVRLALDEPDLSKARRALDGMRRELRDGLEPATACLCICYEALLAATAWDWANAESRLVEARRRFERLEGGGSPGAALAANCIAGVEGVLCGRWDRAVEVFGRVDGWPRRSASEYLICRANAAVAHLEMGLLDEAEKLLVRANADAQDAGMRMLSAYITGTWSDLMWMTDREASERMFAESQAVCVEFGDILGRATGEVHRAMLTRAAGEAAESLGHAEAALLCLQNGGDSLKALSMAAQVELAASLLAMGDGWGARLSISEMHGDLVGSGACELLLCADMVLAEVDRRECGVADAVKRVLAHAEYVATGSANWRVAMYIRAFPGLLGVLCSAYGPESLPLRMLRLVPQDVLERSLGERESFARPDDRVIVSHRVSGGQWAVVTPAPSPSVTACSVRLFGGLEVRCGEGVVAEECWRKRKARLIFAMLVVRQGQDVPRDVVLERLWPDMDVERAKRNFYVTWSAMKRALAGNGTPADAKHLVSCAGGVCRVTRAVRSDLDDFDDAVGHLRSADAIHNAEGVVAAASQLASVYRDELLPGDVYEEWFAEVRERTKHDFCDAMMRGARAAESIEAYGDALALLRRASAADPWREDIYQCMMRCQMAAGQRSRAIETYLSCRARLVDDLGIDPSTETARLYQAVLALEEGVLDGQVPGTTV